MKAMTVMMMKTMWKIKELAWKSSKENKTVEKYKHSELSLDVKARTKVSLMICKYTVRYTV